MSKKNKKKMNLSKHWLNKIKCYQNSKPKPSIFNFLKMILTLEVNSNPESFKVKKRIPIKMQIKMIKAFLGVLATKMKFMHSKINDNFPFSLMC